MYVKINNELRKSRNPLEHGYTVTSRKGKVVHVLGDGYYLVEFEELKIIQMVSVDKKKKRAFAPLQWYIHEDDLQVKK